MCFEFDYLGVKAKFEKENPINQIIRFYRAEADYARCKKSEFEQFIISSNPPSMQYFALMEVLLETLAKSTLKIENKIRFGNSLKDDYIKNIFLGHLKEQK